NTRMTKKSVRALSVVRHVLRDRHASTADDLATQPITAGHATTAAVGVIIVTVVAIIATVVVVTDTMEAVKNMV
ncbi:hypothetical protein EV180_006128, partial [Coemansia sp. RSA 518]